ncbi:MAG: T9SS type A sorting domain-containing protein, partial [Bacteroidetes bacterium]|nr:T9SS type A sorting domain-containing protein [Bacteroidota bacterium]
IKHSAFIFAICLAIVSGQTQAQNRTRSTDKIKIYFNHPVDNSASQIIDAVYTPAFEDTLIAYINSSEVTLDVCNYNTGRLPIVTAINNAQARGVVVRYIAASTELTNNDELGNLSSAIPMIQRPDDGEIMHNKFIIIDAGNAAAATIITGSTNHVSSSLVNDFNNLVIIQDQPLAQAYKTEFEEMWGSTGNLPDTLNAKFGAAKTDNTPHQFTIDGIPVELYFSPTDNTTAHIEAAVRTANTDIEFAMLTYINNDLGDAVIDMKNQGVSCRGIIENIYYIGSEYNGLLSAGVNVLSAFNQPYFMHHKYCVVDATNTSSDPLVITGSHNWTNSAEEENDENTLIIHDAEIANMYLEEFTMRYMELTVGEKEYAADNIRIYPNPTTDNFTIISSNELIESVRVFDALGREVFSAVATPCKRFDVQIENVQSGFFVVKIQLANGEIVNQKLLLN